jgi:5'-3' exonuclease
VGEKTAASLLQKFGDMAGIIAGADDPDSGLGPGPRAKIKAAREYLQVAPRVVAVARDLDVGPYDATLPRTPADHAAVIALADKWNLESPLARVVDSMTNR